VETLRSEAGLMAWAAFLGERAPEELEAVMTSHPRIARAHQELETLSRSEEARELAMLRQRALDGHRLGLGYAQAVGLAEGRAEGLARGEMQGEARPLLSMLGARFGVLDPGLEERVRTASASELLRSSLRVLDATGTDDVFAEAPDASP
jgi:hypothetical protein